MPVSTILTGHIGLVASYVGGRQGVFVGNAGPRQDFPSYVQVDLNGGVRGNSWTVDLFVNNVADKRAALSGGLGSVNPYSFNYVRPRTIGVTLSKTF